MTKKDKNPTKIKDLMKKFKHKLSEKNIIKPNKVTVKIPEYHEEPYRSIYFKQTWDEEKKKLFFK